MRVVGCRSGSSPKFDWCQKWKCPLNTVGARHYSLSDSSLAIAFSIFLWRNFRVCHPNFANHFGALSTTCMYKLTFCLNTAKCWCCSLVPVVKCAHCRQYDLASLSVVNITNTRDCIVGNGQILQWDLMSKTNILQSWEKKYADTNT